MVKHYTNHRLYAQPISQTVETLFEDIFHIAEFVIIDLRDFQI